MKQKRQCAALTSWLEARTVLPRAITAARDQLKSRSTRSRERETSPVTITLRSTLMTPAAMKITSQLLYRRLTHSCSSLAQMCPRAQSLKELITEFGIPFLLVLSYRELLQQGVADVLDAAQEHKLTTDLTSSSPFATPYRRPRPDASDSTHAKC